MEKRMNSHVSGLCNKKTKPGDKIVSLFKIEAGTKEITFQMIALRW
jgi:hypothetical protein